MPRSRRLMLYALATVAVLFVVTWLTIPVGSTVYVGGRPGSQTEPPVAGIPQTQVCAWESQYPGKLVVSSVNGWDTCAVKSDVQQRVALIFGAGLVVVVLVSAARGAFSRAPHQPAS